MKPNKKIYISLAIFGAILLLFIFSVFLPALKQIQKSAEDLVFQRDIFFSLKSQEATFKKLKEDYQNLRPELTKIDNLFLDPDDPVEFLNYLEETGEVSGVEIQTSNFLYLQEDKPWPSFSLQISSSSEFSNFLKFLNRLENSPRVLQLQNLNLQRINSQINASLSIKVFTK